MRTLVLTKEHFTKHGVYSGSELVDNFDGNIEVDSNLGVLVFPNCLNATGYIQVGEGTQISVGEPTKYDNVALFGIHDKRKLTKFFGLTFSSEVLS